MNEATLQNMTDKELIAYAETLSEPFDRMEAIVWCELIKRLKEETQNARK